MKPYWSHGGIEIYHGDCQEILPRLEADSIDLLLTDPPYGVGQASTSYRSRGRMFGPMIGDHDTEAGYEGLRLALGPLRNHRHLYAFGTWDLGQLPVSGTTELIWDKGIANLGDLSQPWGCAHEYIQFGVFTPSAANRDRGSGRLVARLRKGSVLSYQRPNSSQVVDHPTEKPVRLLRELIESSSCIGETVLDPFAGIGSTAVAARVEGRRCIAIEVVERYCEAAAKRLEQLPLELDL